MSEPVVSIIVPKKLANIELEQTFKEFEIIAVDSKSLGLGQAKGKYITFLDTKDTWKPDKLQKQVETLDKNPDIGLVYCGNSIRSFNYNGYVFDQLVMKNFLYPSSVALFRKDCLLKAGLIDENNWEFFLKISIYYKFCSIKEHLVIPEKLDPCDFCSFESSGFKALNRIFQLEDIEARHLRLINQAYAMRYVSIGKKYFNCKLFKEARGYFHESFKRDFSVSFKSDVILFYLLSLRNRAT